MKSLKFSIIAIFLLGFFLGGLSLVCSASSTKPPEPPPGEEEDPAREKSRYAAFYAHPEDLNEDGVIDSRDRFLWKKQRENEMVIE